MRQNLFEILKEKKFDMKAEYSRLYDLFFEPESYYDEKMYITRLFFDIL